MIRTTDKTVLVWSAAPLYSIDSEEDPNVPRLLARIALPHAPNCVRFSPDGALLAVGLECGPIHIYTRVATGANGSSSSSTLVKGPGFGFRSGSADAGAGSEDKTVYSEEYQCVHVLTRHQNHVTDLTWAPTNAFLASSSLDSTVIIWTLATAAPVAVLRGHRGWVVGVSWDPLNQYVASLDDVGAVIVWSVSNSGSDWYRVAAFSANTAAALDHECKPLTPEVKPQTATSSSSSSGASSAATAGANAQAPAVTVVEEDDDKALRGTAEIFTKVALGRLSWSADGAVLAVPRGARSKAPIALCVHRGSWVPASQYVGHTKTVTVAQFSPRMYTKTAKTATISPDTPTGSQSSSASSTIDSSSSASGGATMHTFCVCGGSDGAVSVWSTLSQRAVLVIPAVSTLLDISWSPDGLAMLLTGVHERVFVRLSTADAGRPVPPHALRAALCTVYGTAAVAAAGAGVVGGAVLPESQAAARRAGAAAVLGAALPGAKVLSDSVVTLTRAKASGSASKGTAGAGAGTQALASVFGPLAKKSKQTAHHGDASAGSKAKGKASAAKDDDGEEEEDETDVMLPKPTVTSGSSVNLSTNNISTVRSNATGFVGRLSGVPSGNVSDIVAALAAAAQSPALASALKQALAPLFGQGNITSDAFNRNTVTAPLAFSLPISNTNASDSSTSRSATAGVSANGSETDGVTSATAATAVAAAAAAVALPAAADAVRRITKSGLCPLLPAVSALPLSNNAAASSSVGTVSSARSNRSTVTIPLASDGTTSHSHLLSSLLQVATTALTSAANAANAASVSGASANASAGGNGASAGVSSFTVSADRVSTSNKSKSLAVISKHTSASPSSEASDSFIVTLTATSDTTNGASSSSSTSSSSARDTATKAVTVPLWSLPFAGVPVAVVADASAIVVVTKSSPSTNSSSSTANDDSAAVYSALFLDLYGSPLLPLVSLPAAVAAVSLSPPLHLEAGSTHQHSRVAVILTDGEVMTWSLPTYPLVPHALASASSSSSSSNVSLLLKSSIRHLLLPLTSSNDSAMSVLRTASGKGGLNLNTPLASVNSVACGYTAEGVLTITITPSSTIPTTSSSATSSTAGLTSAAAKPATGAVVGASSYAYSLSQKQWVLVASPAKSTPASLVTLYHASGSAHAGASHVSAHGLSSSVRDTNYHFASASTGNTSTLQRFITFATAHSTATANAAASASANASVIAAATAAAAVTPGVGSLLAVQTLEELLASALLLRSLRDYRVVLRALVLELVRRAPHVPFVLAKLMRLVDAYTPGTETAAINASALSASANPTVVSSDGAVGELLVLGTPRLDFLRFDILPAVAAAPSLGPMAEALTATVQRLLASVNQATANKV